jgi:surfactin family lipopeptide synthetase C
MKPIMHIEHSYPLSPVQHGMLIHSLSAPHSGVYVQQLVSVLREELNVPGFQRAWEQIVSRHPILRTSFSWESADEPLQRVHRSVQLPFEYQDWSDLSPIGQEKLLESFLQSDRQRGFRFDQAPLMRLAVFRCSQAEYRWIWTSHHALLDGRSRLLLLKEFFAFYDTFCTGQTLHLNNPIPYRAYIDWLERKDFTEDESFWRNHLSGFTAPTPLTVDHSRSTRPAIESFGKQTVLLTAAVTSSLRSLAERYRLTPNTFLQGAWALLLSRYSGEPDVVFGATRAGRHVPVEGAESMVGLLINTVPVRVRVSPGYRLLAWLNELRRQWIEMRNFEHAPLVKIQQWSQIPAGKQLFESLLVFENYQLNSALRDQDESWKKREFHLVGTTNYPLTVVGYLEQELVLEMTYDRRRFDDATMTRTLGHLTTLLKEMVSDPARRLSDLPLLTKSERHQLLVEWNDTKKNYPKDQCIHALFERQVERTPDAVAIAYEAEQLTYGELNRRANQLAHYLQRLGVGAEVLVGICMERSIEMMVGLLGVLKAGGAYVPLDPSDPKERLDFVLQDTQAPVLLTQSKLLSQLPTMTCDGRPTTADGRLLMDDDARSSALEPSAVIGHRSSVICLDADWETIAHESESNPASLTAADNLAYVIHTSGTTGQPKGTMIEHRSLVNYLNWVNEFLLGEGIDSLPAIAKPSFDASLKQLLAPLLRGSEVWLVPDEFVTEPATLLRAVSKRKKAGINCVPSLWEAILYELGSSDRSISPENRSCLLVGGEQLTTELTERSFAAMSDLKIWNLYGPTEATANATVARIGRGESVTIGRPVANVRTYILNSHLQPTPFGVPGELYIGGAGVSRGYLNRPDLTAEKFIPNPFSDEPGARLYKTGDLARCRPDGNIEFLGRIDDQVKLRGFRIELREIEAVLNQHPAVRQTVALVHNNLHGGKELAAYVVPQQDGIATINDLRSFLRSKLPEYMIPSAFLFLDGLPLTANGKVDRRALPAPDQSWQELEKSFVPPRTPVEQALAAIWAEVLKLDRVGIHDNFFELKGHSLLATRVISRLRTAFGLEIPLRSLFEMPTVASLAAHVEAIRSIAQGPQTFPYATVGEREEIEL